MFLRLFHCQSHTFLISTTKSKQEPLPEFPFHFLLILSPHSHYPAKQRHTNTNPNNTIHSHQYLSAESFPKIFLIITRQLISLAEYRMLLTKLLPRRLRLLLSEFFLFFSVLVIPTPAALLF